MNWKEPELGACVAVRWGDHYQHAGFYERVGETGRCWVEISGPEQFSSLVSYSWAEVLAGGGWLIDGFPVQVYRLEEL